MSEHFGTFYINPLSANPTKWLNTKTICRQPPMNCLSVFDHFRRLALKGLILNCSEKPDIWIIFSIFKEFVSPPKMERFAKTVIFFAKRSILDVWQHSGYAFEVWLKRLQGNLKNFIQIRILAEEKAPTELRFWIILELKAKSYNHRDLLYKILSVSKTGILNKRRILYLQYVLFFLT